MIVMISRLSIVIFSISLLFSVVFSVGQRALGSDVGVVFGTASNPAQAPGGHAGSYFQFTPQWKKSTPRSEGFVLNSFIAAKIKKFSDKKAARNSDFSLIKGGLSLVKSTLKNSALEFAWAVEHLAGRIAPTDFEFSLGEPNSYLSQNLNLAATFEASPFAFIVGSKLVWQDYSTNVFDEQDQPFQNDNLIQSIYTKLLSATTNRMKFEIGGEWGDQKYRYRKVRGENGISQSDGENLHLRKQDYYFAWIPEFYSFESTTALAYGADQDLVSGISSVRKQKLEQKFLFPLSGRQGLALKTEFSILTRQFSRIHADLSSLEAAKHSGLRSDRVTKLSVGLIKSFWAHLEGSLTLAYLNSDSNFVDEIYEDRIIETGLTAKF